MRSLRKSAHLILSVLVCLSFTSLWGGGSGSRLHEGVKRLDDVRIEWSKVPFVRRGVRLLDLQLEEPRLMKVHVMRVDLRMKGVTFTGTERDPEAGKPMPDYPQAIIKTKRERTADFMTRCRGERGLDMIVASNTAPWWPWCKPWNHTYGDPAGVEISDGKLVSNHQSPQEAIMVIWKDGKIELMTQLPKERFKDVWLAHTGFGIIMKDGKALPGGGYQKPLMPRMSIGFDQHRHYLYLITVDGRQKGWSLGATGAEVQKILEKAGAWDVIDFDGGGSATLCYWDDGKKAPVVVNRHTESGYTRKTGMNWGIYLKR